MDDQIMAEDITRRLKDEANEEAVLDAVMANCMSGLPRSARSHSGSIASAILVDVAYFCSQLNATLAFWEHRKCNPRRRRSLLLSVCHHARILGASQVQSS